MKKAILGFAATLLFLMQSANSQTIMDVYDMNLRLQIPRIYDNMQSLGYRRYQSQRIIGTLYVIYDDDNNNNKIELKMRNLLNLTHKINGKNVTYRQYDYEDDYCPLFSAVGNNRTKVFRKGGVRFLTILEPNYNIGDLGEDNVLQLDFAGIGNIANDKLKSIKGCITGQQGCGCMAYGHISPTRRFFGGVLYGDVIDIAPTFGTFKLKHKRRYVGPYQIISPE